MVKVRKVVITAAGLGTRMLSVTKEMLPLFCVGSNGDLLLKPVLQLIFERLYEVGLGSFVSWMVGGKRSIEDHFTPDYSYVELLRRRVRRAWPWSLRSFIVRSSLLLLHGLISPSLGVLVMLC